MSSYYVRDAINITAFIAGAPDSNARSQIKWHCVFTSTRLSGRAIVASYAYPVWMEQNNKRIQKYSDRACCRRCRCWYWNFVVTHGADNEAVVVVVELVADEKRRRPARRKMNKNLSKNNTLQMYARIAAGFLKPKRRWGKTGTTG